MGDEEASQSAGSWWTLGALSLASFLLTLDDTALSVALPAIGRDLGLGLSGLEWVVNAYTLAIGPLVGAVLTESLGWGSIFLVNVPFGVLGLAFGRTILGTSQPAPRSRHFDLAGMLASGATLFALVFALTQGMSYGWASPLILGSFASAVVGLVVFVRLEQRRDEPLLELALFRSRNLSGANAVSLLSTAVMCGIFFFISLYLQIVRGYSAIAAGAAFLPRDCADGRDRLGTLAGRTRRCRHRPTSVRRRPVDRPSRQRRACTRGGWSCGPDDRGRLF